MKTLRSLNMFSEVGPCGVRCSTPGCTARHPLTVNATITANPTLDSHARRFSIGSSIAERRLDTRTSYAVSRMIARSRSATGSAGARSVGGMGGHFWAPHLNQRALEHDAAVDGAGGLRQQPGGHHGHL